MHSSLEALRVRVKKAGDGDKDDDGDNGDNDDDDDDDDDSFELGMKLQVRHLCVRTFLRVVFVSLASQTRCISALPGERGVQESVAARYYGRGPRPVCYSRGLAPFGHLPCEDFQRFDLQILARHTTRIPNMKFENLPRLTTPRFEGAARTRTRGPDRPQ